MDRHQKRRNINEHPPNLFELMNQFIEHTRSFIRMFDNNQPHLRKIEKQFQGIADMVKTFNTAVTVGGVAGVGFLAVGLLAGPVTGGVSIAAAAAAAFVAGSATYAVAGTSKIYVQKKCNDMKYLGQEFMGIAMPMKDQLEKIMRTYLELEKKSKEIQAGDMLGIISPEVMTTGVAADMLGIISPEVMTTGVIGVISSLTEFIFRIFRATANLEQDKELGGSIIELARLCSKVTHELKEMKEALREALKSS